MPTGKIGHPRRRDVSPSPNITPLQIAGTVTSHVLHADSARILGVHSPSKEHNYKHPNSRFVLRHLLYGLLNLLMIDISRTCTEAAGVTRVRNRKSLFDLPLWQSIGLASLAILATRSGMNILQDVLAPAMLVLRMYKPLKWSPLFGSLGDAWTVRRFWS